MPSAAHARPVRRVGVVYASSLLLEWAADIAMMVTVYAATGSAAMAGAMLVCTQLVPSLGVAAFAARLDGLDARPVLVGATAARGIALLLVAAFGYGPTLFVAAVIAGAGASIARAQLRAGLARMDDDAPGTLRHGNAVLGALRGPCALGGPVVGGLVVGTLGATEGLFAFGVVQLLIAAVAATLPALPPVPAVADEASGIERRQASPVVSLGLLMVIATAFTFAFSVDEPVLMKFTDEVLGTGVAGYSAYFVAWGVGLLLGGLAFTRVADRSMLRVFAAGLAINAVGHVGLVMSPSIGWALLAAAVAGFGNGFDWPAIATAIQERAPRGEEAFVAARFESLTTIGVGLGVACGGVIADTLGARLTLLLPGIAAGLILTLLLFVQLRGRRWSVPGLARLSSPIQGGVS